MGGNDVVETRRTRGLGRRIVLLRALPGLLILAAACQERPEIRARPIHPDMDRAITFRASPGDCDDIQTMKIVVDGQVVSSSPGDSAVATLVPTADHENEKVRFRAVARLGDGSEAESDEDWVYVVNPRVFLEVVVTEDVSTTPAQETVELPPIEYIPAQGGFLGWPDGESQWTGPRLYRLDRDAVTDHAENVLMEYADATDQTLAAVMATSDEVVRAVAWYVEKHHHHNDDADVRASYVDAGGVYAEYASKNDETGDLPLPADMVLDFPYGYGKFVGDCEDFAILRAALLRRLGFHPFAIWNAINGSKSHEYNVVVYGGAFRIMDTYLMDDQPAVLTESFDTLWGWNEEKGPRLANASDDWLEAGADNWPGGKSDGRDWGPKIYLHEDD
jgi:hypothetical protein